MNTSSGTFVDGQETLLYVNGVRTLCRWSSAQQTWFPLFPTFQLQNATPMNSPTTSNTIPISVGGNYLQPLSMGVSQQYTHGPTRVGFPDLIPVEEKPFSLSAREHLDSHPPTFPSVGTGYAWQSSAANLFYANIGRIHFLPLPNDLAGYNTLSPAKAYHPIQLDPLLQLGVEADAIWACKSYIVTPTNMVLASNSYNYPIRSRSEDSHSVRVNYGQDIYGHDIYVNHMSRVDLSWEVQIGGQWIKFAFLEFKRPGALKESEWSPAVLGEGAVEGSGEKICRQIVKYAATWQTPFCCVCDWDIMITLVLRGNREDWVNSRELAPAIEADGAVIRDRSKFKRSLYVFLRMALKYLLVRMGLLQ